MATGASVRLNYTSPPNTDYIPVSEEYSFLSGDGLLPPLNQSNSCYSDNSEQPNNQSESLFDICRNVVTQLTQQTNDGFSFSVADVGYKSSTSPKNTANDDIINFTTQSLSALSDVIKAVPVNKSQIHNRNIVANTIQTVVNSNIIPLMFQSLASSNRNDINDVDSTYLDSVKSKLEESECDKKVLSFSYKDDLNILQVHQIVLRRLKSFGGEYLDTLKEEFDSVKVEISKPQTIINRRITNQRMIELENEINQISESIKLKKYIAESSDLLYQYKIIGPKQTTVDFLNSAKSTSCDNADIRHYIIGTYLDIVCKYIKIDALRLIEFDNCCHICGSSLSQLNQIEDELNFCPMCNVEVKIPPKINSSESEANDQARPRKISDRYEDKGNFIKAVECYKGHPKHPPPMEVYDQLDQYFLERRLPYLTRSEVKIHGYDIDDCKKILHTAMQEIGYPKYENYNLITNVYWGRPLPNIDHLNDQILHDYDVSQEVYIDVKGNRTSSINTQFRLFCLLKNLGWDCSIDEFKIVVSKKSVDWHKETWIKICTTLKWKDPIYLNEIEVD